jgi:hypothetical protein
MDADDSMASLYPRSSAFIRGFARPSLRSLPCYRPTLPEVTNSSGLLSSTPSCSHFV